MSTEMTPDNLNRVGGRQAGKPLNLDYVPNLTNVWDSLQSPFYDAARTTPCPTRPTRTGIAYRTDKVTEDIPTMSNPWDIFWEAEKYTGKTALLDEPRETIAMALLRKQHYDINTEDPKLINAGPERPAGALQHLQHQGRRPAVSNIPEGLAWLDQAWSGDMMAAYFDYLPKGTRPRCSDSGSPTAARGRCRTTAGRSRHHQEAGALPSVVELHARLPERATRTS